MWYLSVLGGVGPVVAEREVRRRDAYEHLRGVPLIERVVPSQQDVDYQADAPHVHGLVFVRVVCLAQKRAKWRRGMGEPNQTYT